jgi:hypothetical protein
LWLEIATVGGNPKTQQRGHCYIQAREVSAHFGTQFSKSLEFALDHLVLRFELLDLLFITQNDGRINPFDEEKKIHLGNHTRMTPIIHFFKVQHNFGGGTA